MSAVRIRYTEPDRLAELRARAASRLAGAAASKGPVARAADALTVLHGLASAPATAEDALTLLHELQVHQVEVDLLAEELEESRAELEADLRRYVALYNQQPVGCVTVDRRWLMCEVNKTAADLLGVTRDIALGSPLDAYFCIESGHRLRAAVVQLDAARPPSSCALRLRARGGPGLAVIARLAVDPAADQFVVSLMPMEEGLQAAPDASADSSLETQPGTLPVPTALA